MLLDKLIDKKLIQPPKWLARNLHFLCIGGSHSYGTNQNHENKISDFDINGIVIPPKEYIFPHIHGHISGFGTNPPKFDQYQQHHIFDKEAKKEYDITVFNIVKFFNLALQGNPNIIDILFTPQDCILTISRVGNLIRENRKLFLSKQCYIRFKGYFFSQYKNMTNKNPIGTRKARVDQYGFDIKFAAHSIRLLGEILQILMEGDLDIRRNKEELKSIRRGDWSLEQINEMVARKEGELETAFVNSKLREKPDEDEIKNLLLQCLEIQYENIDEIITRPDQTVSALRDIDKILDKLKHQKVI